MSAGGLSTRFTRAFGLRVPVASAPMAGAAPAGLAAAVSGAGGLGLLGGGYGLEHDIGRAFDEAGGVQIGVGFITWALAERGHLLDEALARRPRAVMLSFGDLAPFAAKVRAAGVPLICQCQTLRHVREALAAEAEVVVAQGSEAGGHGASRGTMSFVAEVADFLGEHRPETLLLAAGGIADGRGLAAALMLGADGVLMGTRFWASRESGVKASLQDAAIAADGDATVRTNVPDLARGLRWPWPFTISTLNTGIIRDWAADEEAARAQPELQERLRSRYAAGAERGDPEDTAVVVGQATGLIRDRPSAAELVRRISAEAAERLRMAPGFVTCASSS